jgi:type I restriction enzyme S subunit
LLITQQLNSKAAGSGQPLINQEILNSIDVLTPPLPEQRAIAAILSSFDDKIELLRRQNKTLEAIAQTTFKEWFVKFNVPVEFKVNSEKLIVNSSRENTKSEKLKVNTKTGLPEGWRMGKLGDVIEIYGGGTPKTNLSEYWNGVIPWFSVVDVPSEGNIFVIKCEKHITQKGLENSSTRMLPVNTTIITARGTVGKLALVGVPMAMNQSCYGIYPKDSKSFFYIYLMIKDSLTMLKQQVHGAVFDTITRDTLNNISVNIPTNKIIELFEDTITPCFHKVLQNNFQIQTLSKLRDSLLPKLMKGETRVKDTEPFIKEKIK